MVVAAAICLVGVALPPLVVWLDTPPKTDAGVDTYIRWPGRDGAKAVSAIAGFAVFVVVLPLMVFAGVLIYYTAKIRAGE
jgi:hypothetical protein